MAHNQMTISTDFDSNEFQDDLFKILFKILLEPLQVHSSPICILPKAV